MKFLVKSLLLAAFAGPLLTATCDAQKLSDWQRVPFDDAGVSVLVQLHEPSGKPASAYFGYRCYNEEEKFGLGSTAYFIKIDNAEMACMKDPVVNVTLTIDGKTYSQRFTCDSKTLGSSLYFEWGEGSRADLNNMFDLDQAIDKARSKEMMVLVTDKNHYVFRGSLRNASIRKKISCNRPR